MTTNLIIDFDSTFVSVESLDELAQISLYNNPEKDHILRQIKKITQQGMNGIISFEESLHMRMKLINFNREHLAILIKLLNEKVTPSIRKNKSFFRNHKDNMYIISGGFMEFISPVVKKYGIEESHILANSFTVNDQGKIIGYDKTNFLSQKSGKVKAVKTLKLSGKIVVIGDGYTDYEIRKDQVAHTFIAFTENIIRPNVVSVADKTVASFDEIVHEYSI